MERRCCRVFGRIRVCSADIAATLADIRGMPVKTEPVPRARWEEIFRAQGRKNPTPRIQRIEGCNEGWIEFEGGVKGQTSLKTVLEELGRDTRKQAA